MSSKEYTFQSLFGSQFIFIEEEKEKEIVLNKIEIPIIQRDYAQGRLIDEVRRIREKFLDALFQSIINNKHMTLDFVYGDVSDLGVLTPLDGQQRLTTLFLLHWYIAKKEGVDAKECEFLSLFSYATRCSSRDFCQELVKYTPDFSKGNLAETIKDQHWFPYEWKNDPTIQGILVMIEAIHEKFCNQLDLWKSLVNNKNISFYFLPLSDMGLTDDLYIKMNSRGKPLTPFEHFKAEFEEIIKKKSEELSKKINHRFDIEWTDMLFPFRGDNNIIDDEFMRYFRFVSDIICYQSKIEFKGDEFKLAKLLYGIDNEKALENIEYLINSFDCWCKIDIEYFFNKFFSKRNYERNKVTIFQDDLNIFKECCDNYGEYSGRNRRFPLNKILLLFSINIYLQNIDKISEYEFSKRIRIIRNLIWNSPDEIRDDRDRMKTLLTEIEEIILTNEIPISERGEIGFNVKQKEEERNKKEWLKTNSQKEDELFHLEDHTLLRGCIAVIDLNNSDNFGKFRLLFDNCGKDLINRALLSIGDYSQLLSWRFQIGVKSNESVWFDLFHPTNQRQGFDNTFKMLNTLLSAIDVSDIKDEFLELLVNQYLDLPDTPKDWRYYLVKYKQMRQGNFGMYFWKNRQEKPYEIIMMNTETRPSGKNWDVSLYTLSQIPDFAGQLSLGDYGYQGNKLKIKDTGVEIDCLNDKYVVFQNEIQTDYAIKQSEGIDIEDRIEKGKQIIKELIN